MTPLEIFSIIILSLWGIYTLLVIGRIIAHMIREAKAKQNIENFAKEIFKNIEKDMKEQRRAEFFADLERIKKENEENKK